MVTVPDYLFGGLLVVFTHSEVRIGYMVSHISVSHLSVPFYSVGKVFAPSEVYIYLSHCMLD